MPLPVLDSGGRDTQHGGSLANTAERVDHLERSSHVADCMTFAHPRQHDRANLVVASHRSRWHARTMLRQADILTELAARGIKQGEIADALGITRPNANKLFKPAAKTGKTRSLTFDEGVTLIERFGLDKPDDSPVEAMGVRAARLVVQYVAQQLGVKIDPDDGRVEDLAQDIRAYSEFVATAHVGDNQDRAQGWLDGRRSRSLGRS